MTNTKESITNRLVRVSRKLVVSAKRFVLKHGTILYQKYQLRVMSRHKGKKYKQYLNLQLERTQLKNNANIRFHTQFLIDKLMEVKHPDLSASVLCIGCRNRNEIDYFRAHGFSKVLGIDLLSEYPDIRIMDMHNMSFPDNYFDVIYSAHSLEHSFDPQQVILEIARVARTEAIVVIEVPVKYALSKVDLVDFESLDGLHTAFSDHIKHIIWSEEKQPRTEGNPLGTSIIRSIFSIRK